MRLTRRVFITIALGIIISTFLISSAWTTTGDWTPSKLADMISEMGHKLGTWPPKSSSLPYTAVILYLASLKRQTELIKSLTLLQSNLPTEPWPIILFHTGDYDDADLRANLTSQVEENLGVNGTILDAAKFASRIEFERLEWVLPDGISDNVRVVNPVFDGVWPGYHHMCSFFTSKIFHHPRLQDVTYYLRLDTDSFIEEPMCYDPFEVMYRRERTYGYRYLGADPPYVTRGMWPFVINYVQQNDPAIEQRLIANEWKWPLGYDEPRNETLIEEQNFPGFYNNFEIVKLEAFRRKDVTAFLDELTSVPERTYKWRWGDSPIRFATVNMFFDRKTEVEHFCGISYFHQFKVDQTCPCEPLDIE